MARLQVPVLLSLLLATTSPSTSASPASTLLPPNSRYSGGGFSLDNGPPFVATFTEQGPPIRICPACTWGGLPADDDSYLEERVFTSGSVTIGLEGYVAGVDVLALPPLVDLAIEGRFDAATGVLALVWSAPGKVRTASNLQRAVRAVTYFARGRDPMLAGVEPSRTATFTAVAVVTGGVLDQQQFTAWPPLGVTISIVGRNDAPIITQSASDVNLNPPRVCTFVEGSSTRTLLWPTANTTLNITDVDDAFASAASVTIVRNGAGFRPYAPAEDMLRAWDIGEIDPTAGAVTAVWDGSSGILSLTGVAPLRVYAAALAAIGYVNIASGVPTLGPRLIWGRVLDESATQVPPARLWTAAPISAIVEITPVSHPPIVAWVDAVSEAAAAAAGGVIWRPTLSAGENPIAAPVPLFGGAQLVTFSDPDDKYLAFATILLTRATCLPGEDVLAWAAPTMALSALFTARFNASACSLLLLGPATPSQFSAASVGVTYVNGNVVGGPTAGVRGIEIFVTDSSAGGALSPDAALSSAPLTSTLTVTRPILAPKLLAPPSALMWVVDGDAYGRLVTNGQLLAGDDPNGPGYFFFVTGGAAADSFEVNPSTGALFVSALGVSLLRTGPVASIEVTLSHVPLGGPSTVLHLNISILDPQAAPTLASGGAALPSIASDGYLLHGLPSRVCVDRGSAFVSGSGVTSLPLRYTLLWVPPTAPQEPVPLDDPRLVALFLPSDPLVWAPAPPTLPSSLTGVVDVWCLSGTPTAHDLPSTPSSRRRLAQLQGPSAMPPTRAITLTFALSAAPLAYDGVGASAHAVTSTASWAVRIEVAGCRDPAATYVPCIRGNVTVPDAVALAALGAPKLSVGALVCDNACSDALGSGSCDNACDLSAQAALGVALVGPCLNPVLSVSSNLTSAAANPGGNFDPFATVDSIAPAAACILPPRFASAPLTLPIAPMRLSAFARANGGGVNDVPRSSLPARPLLGVDALYGGEDMPCLSNTSAWVAQPPLRVTLLPPHLTRLDVGVMLEDLPPAQASGGATLDVPAGALDALIAEALTAQEGPFSSAKEGELLNVSLPISLQRVAWPVDVPLPPISPHAPFRHPTPPTLDLRSLVRLAPGGVNFPRSTAPARFCLHLGNVGGEDALLRAAWGVDPSRRRVPLLVAAEQVVLREVPGVPGDGLSPAAMVQGGGSEPDEGAYSWLPRSGYRPWEVLPLLNMGDSAAGGEWDTEAGRVAALAAGATPPPLVGTTRLCALFRTLPAIVGVAWASPNDVGSSALGADVNTDTDAPASSIVSATSPLSTAASSSSPTSLMPYAGALFFSASSGVRKSGRELWRIAPPSTAVTPGATAGIDPVAALAIPGAIPGTNESRVLLAQCGGLPYSLPVSPATLTAPSTAAPASLVADLFAPGSPGADSAPRELTVYRGKLYFVATGVLGTELYAFDAFATHASQLNAGGRIRPQLGEDLFGAPPASTSLPYMSTSGGTISPAQGAYSCSYRRQQRRMQQTTLQLTASALVAGPVLVTDIVPGLGSSSPAWLTLFAGSLIFAATSPPRVTGSGLVSPPDAPRRELWAYADASGTESAQVPPRLVASLNAPHMWGGLGVGGGYSDPQHLTVCGPLLGWPGTPPPSALAAAHLTPPMLFFSAFSTTSNIGEELWSLVATGSGASSSNASGTEPPQQPYFSVSLAADILPGPGSSSPSFLTCHCGVLLFTAQGALGREVLGFSTTTRQVMSGGDIAPGTPSAFASAAVNPFWAAMDDALFFAADDGVHGISLWQMDSWEDALALGVLPHPMLATNDANLWSEAPGGGGGLSPAYMTLYAGTLHFACTVPNLGRELCALQRRERRIVLVANLDTTGEALPGLPPPTPPAPLPLLSDGSSNPTDLAIFDGSLWFAADDGLGGHGRELFSYTAPHHAVDTTTSPSSAVPYAPCATLARAYPTVSWLRLASGVCAATLTPSGGGLPGDAFGRAVAADRGTLFQAGGAAIALGLAPSGSYASQLAGGSSFAAGDAGWTYARSRDASAEAAEARVSAAGAAAVKASLTPPLGMRAGDCVALGRKGGRAFVVGAPGARGDAGAAFVFEAVEGASSRVGGVGPWVQTAELHDPLGLPSDSSVPRIGDALGYSVAIDGGLVAVGAPYVWGQAVYDEALTSPSVGSVLVFARGNGGCEGSGGWVLEAPSLPHPSGGLPAYSALGASVAVFGSVVVAGAPMSNSSTGSAWLWLRTPPMAGEGTPAVWALQQRLDPAGTPAEVLAGAPLVSVGDAYGCAVAITFGVIAVSACSSNQGAGAVFLWRWDTTMRTWTLPSSNSILTQPLAPPLSSSAPLLGAFFGTALSLHGTLLAVGAPGATASGASSAGSAPQGGVFLFSADDAGRFLPASASLASDIAARTSEGALVGMLTPDTEWGSGMTASFGSSIAVTTQAPPIILVGTPGSGLGSYAASGGAVVLEPDAGTPFAFAVGPGGVSVALSDTAHLLPALPEGSGAFGSAVAVAGALGVISAPGARSGAGVVYVTACPTRPCNLEAGEFEARACTPGHDRVCAPCASGACADGTFESRACAASSNRVCTPCSACATGTLAIPGSCVGVSDTVCSGGVAASGAAAVVATAAAAALATVLPSLRAASASSWASSEAAWQQRVGLLTAFSSSLFQDGTWADAGAAAAWGASVAAGAHECTGVTASGKVPLGHIGAWPGIVCDASARITSMRLGGMGMRGTLAPWLDVSAFPFLRSLDVSNNPALRVGDALSSLPTVLEHIDLSGCNLSDADGAALLAAILASPLRATHLTIVLRNNAALSLTPAALVDVEARGDIHFELT